MTNELTLFRKNRFGEVEADIYRDGSDEMYMTARQLGECLGYSDKNSFKSLISRNPYLKTNEFSMEVALCNPLDNNKTG